MPRSVPTGFGPAIEREIEQVVEDTLTRLVHQHKAAGRGPGGRLAGATDQPAVVVRAIREDDRVRILVERARRTPDAGVVPGVMVAARSFVRDEVQEMRMTEEDLRDLGLIVMGEISAAFASK